MGCCCSKESIRSEDSSKLALSQPLIPKLKCNPSLGPDPGYKTHTDTVYKFSKTPSGTPRWGRESNSGTPRSNASNSPFSLINRKDTKSGNTEDIAAVQLVQTQAGVDMAASGTHTRVHFHVTAYTQHGQNVHVSGASVAMGRYSPHETIPLFTTPDQYPVWSTEQPVLLRSGNQNEYVYGISAGGVFKHWEVLENNQPRMVVVEGECDNKQ